MNLKQIAVGLGIGIVIQTGRAFEPAAGVEVDRFLAAKAADAGAQLSGAKYEALEDRVFVERVTGPLALDAYVPEGEGPFPGVLLVHGGGWTGGTKESFRSLAKRLATLGYTAVTSEYRLAGTAKFPAAVHDVKAAVRWMRTHAAELRLDPERVVAVGGSAGGHLVGMVATTGDDSVDDREPGGVFEPSCTLRAAVLMGAGVDQYTRAMESPKPISNQLVFFGGTVEIMPDVYREASPIHHLSPATPPLLFLDGELDQPGERYVEMRKRMDALGVHHELTVVEGGKHGCWGSLPWREVMAGEMDRFFRSVLNLPVDPEPTR